MLCPLCKSHGASKMEFINYLVRETAGSPDIVYTDPMAEAAFDAYCINNDQKDDSPGPIADGNWPQPGGGHVRSAHARPPQPSSHLHARLGLP